MKIVLDDNLYQHLVCARIIKFSLEEETQTYQKN